jgi:hypothetical protein
MSGSDRSELISRKSFSDGGEWSSRLFQLSQLPGHATFEIEAVIEDEVGRQQLADIVSSRRVEVRIDTRSHENLDIERVGSDPSNEVADEIGRGDQTNLLGCPICRGEGLGRRAVLTSGSRQKQEGQTREQTEPGKPGRMVTRDSESG